VAHLLRHVVLTVLESAIGECFEMWQQVSVLYHSQNYPLPRVVLTGTAPL
jgi:hypothetical protein